ncbi:MAG: HAMP domain-containing sensor histidine kinase [Actinomycetota bacterium]
MPGSRRPGAGSTPAGFRFRRQRLRTQLALSYAGLFFVSGAVLLTIPGTALVGIKRSVRVGSGNRAAALAQHGTDVHRLVVGSVAGLAVMFVLSLVLGWLMAGRLLRPLRTITATARDISASNLQRRLRLGGRDDEFRELGETLDDLFGRLEASFASQRHFVANASHELRTPLTAQRALVQVALADPDATAPALRSACAEVLALNRHQERLIDALLTLASSERGIEQREPFDLAEVAGKAVLARHQEAAERGIHLDTALATAPVTGDPRLAGSLVANLVDNALRHNVAGGRAEISTALTGERGCLTVRNTGAVIPPDEVGPLFQPFRQLGSERVGRAGGHGLGLAIVQAIAAAHGATVAAQARPGGGLDIAVSFPAQPGGAP